MEVNKTIAVVIAFVVVAAGSFWGGTYYQSFQIRQSFANRQFGGGGFGGPQGQPSGFGGGQGQPAGGGGPGGGAGFGNGGPGGPGNGVPGGGAGRGPGGTRTLSGRLDQVSGGKLTLTTAFGSVKVTLDKAAKVKLAKAATSTDLKVGSQVIIQGSTGADGQMTAKSVIGE
jgi:hypothetical protein